VLKVIILGSLVEKEAVDIAQTVYEIFDQYKPDKVLIDCTYFIGRLGVVETYTHVRESRPGKHRPSKVAVFDNPENKNYFSFYETTGANIGLRARFLSKKHTNR
jgi:hypothetical protein